MSTYLIAARLVTAHAYSDLYNAYEKGNIEVIREFHNGYLTYWFQMIDEYPLDYLRADYDELQLHQRIIHDKAIELVKELEKRKNERNC